MHRAEAGRGHSQIAISMRWKGAPPAAPPMRRATAVAAVPSSSPRRRRLRFFGSARQGGAPTTRPPWQARRRNSRNPRGLGASAPPFTDAHVRGHAHHRFPRRPRATRRTVGGRMARPSPTFGGPAPQSPPSARSGLDGSLVPRRPPKQRSRRPRRRLRLAAFARPRAAPCLPHLERCQSGLMDWLATPVRSRLVRGPPRVRIPPSPPSTACCPPSRESTCNARDEFGSQPRTTPCGHTAKKPGSQEATS